ncbi:MAG: hypothetical protein PHQ47_01105 [Candidatus Portnoybacteria bacterium]|nr:hypothetical protein [Candidatus Portnoybacteria bacterium]
MKINEQQMQIILEDLYSVEPGLRKHEEELKKILFEIVQLRPEANFDENYRLQLRRQLMVRVSEMQRRRASKPVWENIFTGRTPWIMAGALAAVILIISGGFLVQKKGLVSLNLKQEPLAQKFEKISLGDNAFGSLVVGQSAQGTLGRGGGGGNGSEAYGLGGGGSASVPVAGDAKMIAPFYGYKYVYKGDPLELKDDSVEVLRRMGFDVAASGLGKLLSTFGMGMVNLASFGSLNVQTINFVSEGSFGYMISANPQEGSVYISQNYLTWPQPFADCRDSACYEQKRLRISDVLPDEEVLKIADEFVKAHGLNLSFYGPPEIMNEWRLNYEKTEDKSQFYIPEVVTALYPLMLNGKYVYDEGGNKTGMSVSVNLREKRADGIGNITSQKYEASNYAAETDVSRILKLAEHGGYWGLYYPESANIMEIEIGAPTVGHVLMSRSKDGKNSFLLVPSLIFPVIGQPNPNYYTAQNIVVPLAKELIEERRDFWIMPSPAVDAPAAAEGISTAEIKN